MNTFFIRALLSCIGMGVSLFASGQGKLNGTVLDEHGRGADAATVMLIAQPNNVLVGTTLTDRDGHFSFAAQQGHFLLYIRMLGYKEVKQDIAVGEGTTIANIRLVPDEIHLKDVVITARKSRPITSASNGKIRIHVAQSYLADVGNAIDVLKHSPGVSVNNKGDISLATLGGTAIYVNGKKLMLQGDELTAYLRALPSSKIAHIETAPNPNASFEADGAGGIINIVLKTAAKSGIFLTASNGLSYWENLKQNTDLAFAYNTNKWQLGLSYNHSLGHYAMDYGYEKMQQGDKSQSSTVDTDKRNTFAVGIDFSWQPSSKSQWLINSSVSMLAGPGLTQTTTYVYQGTSLLDGTLKASNDYKKQRQVRYNNSLSYRYQPTKEHSLSFTVDWIHFDGTAHCEQPNHYFSAANTLIRSDRFYSQPDKTIDIYALLADYKFHPNEQDEWLAGLKTSLIKSDNDFLFKKNGTTDPQRSNHFYYNEKNLEGYLQYAHAWQKVTLSAGMRMEYMHTHNRLNAYRQQTTEDNRRSKLQLFPNLSATYTIDEKNKVALFYSRRQDKPRYEDLNPFEYLLDELSYWKGNPFLKPQISHKITLNYTRGNLSMNVYYNQLDDYFTALTDVFDHNKTIMTTKNIGKQQQMGTEAIFSKRLTAWWDFNTNLGCYYFINKLDYETYRQHYKRPSCSLSMGNTLFLPWGINAEISGRYHSKRQGGSYEVSRATGSIDLGLNKSWDDGRMRLSLLMTDILHSERWDSYGTKDALHLASWGYGESRKIVLRFSYSFGKQQLNKVERTLEELERL